MGQPPPLRWPGHQVLRTLAVQNGEPQGHRCAHALPRDRPGGDMHEARSNPPWLLGPGSDPSAFPRTKKRGRPLSPAVEDCHEHSYRSGQGQAEPVTAETLALSTAKGPDSNLRGHLSPFLKRGLGEAFWLPATPPRPEGQDRQGWGRRKVGQAGDRGPSQECPAQMHTVCTWLRSDPPGGGGGCSSRFHWRHDGCTCGLGPGWPGRLEADNCPHTQRPRGCSEAVELPPDGGASHGHRSRPAPGGLPEAEPQRCPSRPAAKVRGSACIPPSCPHSPSRLAVQGVPGARPCLGAPAESKGGKLHLVPRHTHLQDFVPPQRTRANISFPR